jgi:hypothetical protein
MMFVVISASLAWFAAVALVFVLLLVVVLILLLLAVIVFVLLLLCVFFCCWRLRFIMIVYIYKPVHCARSKSLGSPL